jgi:excisionase family DNA binding protein
MTFALPTADDERRRRTLPIGTFSGSRGTESVTGNSLPAFLTAREVADMLRVDERTVLRWAQNDASMPATRLGRVIRFEREPLLRWLARKQPRTAGSLVGARGRGSPNVA